MASMRLFGIRVLGLFMLALPVAAASAAECSVDADDARVIYGRSRPANVQGALQFVCPSGSSRIVRQATERRDRSLAPTQSHQAPQALSSSFSREDERIDILRRELASVEERLQMNEGSHATESPERQSEIARLQQDAKSLRNELGRLGIR